MKICIVLFVLIATSLVSAQDVLSVSIQAELDIIFTSTQTQITTVADILVVAIQTAGKLHNKANANARGFIIWIFNMIGRDGKFLESKINEDAEKTITSINQQINIQVEQVQQTFINIQQSFVSLVQTDVDALKVVVKANNAAMKCWKDNKDAIQTFAKSARKQVLSIVTTSVNTLSTQNWKLSNQISSAGIRIQGEALKKCKLGPYCTIKHFMDNFSAISDEFNGFGNSAVNQVNVVVVDVQTKSIEVVNIVTMYYQTVAKNIRSCTKAFADAAKSSKENKSS